MGRGKLYLVWSLGLTNLIFVLSLLILQFDTMISDLWALDLLLIYTIAYLISLTVGVLRYRYERKTDFNILSAYMLFFLLILWFIYGQVQLGSLRVSAYVMVVLLALIPTFILTTIAWKIL